MARRLREGTTITMNEDPTPGRQYEIVGRAMQDGAWWAYPTDGLPVPDSLKHEHATGNAAWANGGNSTVIREAVTEAEDAQLDLLFESEIVY